MYNGTEIKQYLGCVSDGSPSGESMALNVTDKVNLHLNFLYGQN